MQEQGPKTILEHMVVHTVIACHECLLTSQWSTKAAGNLVHTLICQTSSHRASVQEHVRTCAGAPGANAS